MPKQTFLLYGLMYIINYLEDVIHTYNKIKDVQFISGMGRAIVW